MNTAKKKILNLLMLGAFVIFSTTALVFIPENLKNSPWARYFLLPLLISLIGAWLWLTGMFVGVEKVIDKNKRYRRSYKSEKELTKKILKIKNFDRF